MLGRWIRGRRGFTVLAGVGVLVAGLGAGMPLPVRAGEAGLSASTVTAAGAHATLLDVVQAAGGRSGVPWPVLAGLAWQQSRDGMEAPGETPLGGADTGVTPLVAGGRALRGVAASLTGSAGQRGPDQIFPELIPPITSPGYGMWLLRSPSVLHDDPQNVPQTVNDLASLMARDAAQGVGGMPASRLESAAAMTDPAARTGWARIIARLPIVLQGSRLVAADQAVSQAGDYVPPSACPGAASVLTPTILGAAQASETRALDWYRSQSWDPAMINGTPVAQVIDDYYRVGAAEGVRSDWAFVQAVLETGGFRSDDTALDNFAGIGHPVSAASGSAFPSVLAGVTAQIQLLKRVASGNGTTLVLPAAAGLPMWGGRSAATWAGLAGNWAAATDYGFSLAALHADLMGGGGSSLCSTVPPTTTSAAGPAPVGPGIAASAAPGPQTARPVAAPAVRAGGATPQTTVTAPGPAATTGPGTPAPTPPSTTAPVATGRSTPVVAPAPVQLVTQFLLRQVGRPWEQDGQGPEAWDTAGLAVAAYHQIGIALPAGSAALVARGTAVPGLASLEAGDLVWSTVASGTPVLEGISVGHGEIVTVPVHGAVRLVAVSSLPTAGTTARRIIGTAMATATAP